MDAQHFCYCTLSNQSNSDQEAELDKYTKMFLNPGPCVESYKVQQLPLMQHKIEELKEWCKADQAEGLAELCQMREHIK